MEKLSDIVREYCIEVSDYNFNRAPRFYQYATAGLREINMDMSAIPKSVTIPIDFETCTCDLPPDFLNYLSINLIGRDGLLVGLGENNFLNLTSYFNNCGQHIRKTLPPPVVGQWQGQLANPTYLANHVRNAENFGGYFNAGGNNNVGGYRIDYNTRKIFVAALRLEGASIVLEYIADINSDDQDYQVHVFLIEAIKAWIYWKSIQRDRNFGMGEKAQAEMAYRNAYRKAMHRFNNMTRQELIDSMRKGNSAIPKF